jgi:hypothetical protein
MKTLRDEEREVGVLVAGGLEARVELALDLLPHGVAVGLDDHAALDHLGGLGHLGLADHVLVPLRVVLGAGVIFPPALPTCSDWSLSCSLLALGFMGRTLPR